MTARHTQHWHGTRSVAGPVDAGGCCAGERPWRHLCPEADERDAMTDEEFWAHVFPSTEQDPGEVEPLDVAIAQDVCGECGSVGACAWDSEGRPMIHATPFEEDA